MRQLATIQRINAVYEIEGRDRIVQYGINGWRVIGQKGQYAVGDLVVYLEVDSWVPNALAPFLSRDKEPRVYEGIPGERLKTIKLGGALSQGLLLSMDVLQAQDGSWKKAGQWLTDSTGEVFEVVDLVIDEGTDVTAVLGILKWERSPEFISANSKGNFPYFIRKTDETRIQNITRERELLGKVFQISEKLEGQSFTAYKSDGVYGVCSRNQDLKLDEVSTWTNSYHAYNMGAKLDKACEIVGADLAIQCEQIGPGVEGNIYGLSLVQLRAFKVWNIDTQSYLLPGEFRDLMGAIDMPTVPDLGYLDIPPDGSLKDIRENLLKSAYRCSKLANVVAEGIVLSDVDGSFSFKAVSDEYLLKDKQATPWKGDKK